MRWQGGQKQLQTKALRQATQRVQERHKQTAHLLVHPLPRWALQQQQLQQAAQQDLALLMPRQEQRASIQSGSRGCRWLRFAR